MHHRYGILWYIIINNYYYALIKLQNRCVHLTSKWLPKHYKNHIKIQKPKHKVWTSKVQSMTDNFKM